MDAYFETILDPPNIKVVVRGKTLAHLFTNGVAALGHVLEYSPSPRPHNCSRNILVRANDINELLVRFLNETLHQSHANGEVYRHAAFPLLTYNQLQAVISGNKTSIFDEHIKKIHPHDASLVKKHNCYEAVLTLDI
jgi:SHS2 domain-containing protein